MRIGFSVLPHTDPSSTARDAVFAADGGPGSATTADKGFFSYIAGDVLADRDLVLVDNRGTGTSGAIDCPGLQIEPPDHDGFLAGVAACGAALGRDADRYGAGDVAMDIEVVRRTLGYPQITYYGLSYGTVDVAAYAVRYPGRVRAVVLDGGLTVNDRPHAWAWGLGMPKAIADAITLTCRRAPACAAENPHAASSLARLAAELRRRPVDGTVLDDAGIRTDVHVDESKLISIVESGQLGVAEIPAVEAALRSGDPVPLLRLAAESPDRGGDSGDPTHYSAGDNAAAFCNDQDFVFERTDSTAVRQGKYDAALAALPVTAFAPFSKQAWTGWFYDDACVAWPAPDRYVPAVPYDAVARGVPALVLRGDLDTVVSSLNSHSLLAIFPSATYVSVAGAGHPSAGWSSCAADLARSFMSDPKTPVGTCREPAFVGAAVPSYPASVRAAPAARQLHDDRSTVLVRRATTVAVRAAQDIWLRSFRNPGRTGTTPGLRGGEADWDYATFPDHAVMTLHHVVFAHGVSVSGTSERVYGSNGFDVHLVVKVGRSTITLDGTGQWGFGGPFKGVTLTGSSGSRALHLKVPAT